jgi:hypothetical protein
VDPARSFFILLVVDAQMEKAVPLYNVHEVLRAGRDN